VIKGGPEDDAVLCTSDKTYNIRSVILSNSVLLVSPSPRIDGSENQVVIQDSLNELLELVPAVPRLYRMNVLLKEHEWEEGHEEDEDESFRAVSHFELILYPIMARLIDYFPRRSGNGLLLKMLR
jgi:sister chromatid cohesion protein DCC1